MTAGGAATIFFTRTMTETLPDEPQEASGTKRKPSGGRGSRAPPTAPPGSPAARHLLLHGAWVNIDEHERAARGDVAAVEQQEDARIGPVEEHPETPCSGTASPLPPGRSRLRRPGRRPQHGARRGCGRGGEGPSRRSPGSGTARVVAVASRRPRARALPHAGVGDLAPCTWRW